MYDCLFINDTNIINDYNYNWITFTGGHTPTTGKKHKFKWVLYANKFRNRNN